MMYQVYSIIPEIKDDESKETELQKNLKKAINTPPKKLGYGLFSMFQKKPISKDTKTIIQQPDDPSKSLVDQLSSCSEDIDFKVDSENIKKAGKDGMESENMFKALLKAYTGTSLHHVFVRKMISAQYS